MTHRALRILFTAVFVLGLLAPAWAESVPRMDKDTLKSKLDDPNLMLIDVRLSSDWNGSIYKLPGATHFDPEAIEDRISEFDKDKEYVFYCA